MKTPEQDRQSRRENRKDIIERRLKNDAGHETHEEVLAVIAAEMNHPVPNSEAATLSDLLNTIAEWISLASQKDVANFYNEYPFWYEQIADRCWIDADLAITLTKSLSERQWFPSAPQNLAARLSHVLVATIRHLQGIEHSTISIVAMAKNQPLPESYWNALYKQTKSEVYEELKYLSVAVEAASHQAKAAGMAITDTDDTTTWPTQATAAQQLEITPGRLKHLIDEGRVKTNGKTGRDCRVNPASILERKTSKERRDRIGHNKWADEE